jgi:Zn-finger nucleic acid-binding protein
MQCPIHGTTLPATEHEDYDIACPECRQVWSDRGNLYELPHRDTPDDPPSPHPD